MKRALIGLALVAATATMSAAQAAPFVLTFEGLGDLEPVGDFYNGGLGGNGSGPGPNFGVTFSSNSLAIIDADAGGTGNIGGEPTPDTVLFFLTGNAAIMKKGTYRRVTNEKRPAPASRSSSVTFMLFGFVIITIAARRSMNQYRTML